MAKDFIRKAALVTRPVAWCSETPTKYQSFLEFRADEKRTIRICGDPKPTEEDALESLTSERLLWEEAIYAFRNVEL